MNKLQTQLEAKDKLIKELTQTLENVQNQAYTLTMACVELQEDHGGDWGEGLPNEERTIFTGMDICPGCGCVEASTTQDNDEHPNPCMWCP